MNDKETSTTTSPLDSKFLIQADAAKYLKCCRTKFYFLRKQFQIPHYRHGGVLYFLKDDLDAYFLGLKATLPKK